MMGPVGILFRVSWIMAVSFMIAVVEAVHVAPRRRSSAMRHIADSHRFLICSILFARCLVIRVNHSQ